MIQKFKNQDDANPFTPKWQAIIKDTVTTSQEVCEIAYVPSFSSQEQARQRSRSRRYFVIRKPKAMQDDLFADAYVYTVFVTNDQNPNINELVKLHRGRNGSVEYAHSQIKGQCGMNIMPSNDFKVNAAYFSIGIFTHNILKLMQRHLFPKDKDWQKIEIKTLRFRILRSAALIKNRARQLVMIVGKNHPLKNIYEQFKQYMKELTTATSPPNVSTA